MPLLLNILSIAAMIFGFGFVVFFHELGHFLAAKWVGIKVEQFAVGFGHALFSWRSGLGFRRGSSRKEYERRLEEHLSKSEGAPPTRVTATKDKDDEEESPYTQLQLARASQELGLGETEYRINYLPLGGYVKMLGQDDLHPNATSEDPRSYNRKSIKARMLVISAGVLMNVLLAFLLFFVLYLVGHRVPAPIIAEVQTGSPAEQAGLRVGDRVLVYDGETQHSSTGLRMAVALTREGRTVVMHVRRPDGTEADLMIQPRRPGSTGKGQFLDLGIGPNELHYPDLRGPTEREMPKWDATKHDAAKEIVPGDVVVRVGDTPVQVDQFYVLDQALQSSAGKAVPLTIRDAQGRERVIEVEPRFVLPLFGNAPFNIAGIQPRTTILAIEPGSPATGKIEPNDIILGFRRTGEATYTPDPPPVEFMQIVRKAADDGAPIDLLLERGQARVEVKAILPNFKIEGGTEKHKGLGVLPAPDVAHLVAGGVLPDSPAARAAPVSTPATLPTTTPTLAGLPRGARLLAIDGQTVTTWPEVLARLRAAGAQATIRYETGEPGATSTQVCVMATSPDDHTALENIRYAQTSLALPAHIEVRKTTNPLVAAKWGVTETRDMILQLYVMLQRLMQRSVPASGLSGPVGIVTTGAVLAMRGPDWLIWFLAMISANLAVVNFLPIPVVDGGQFLFLIIEKIKGKPLSPKMQTVAQLVGLAIIISVFVFVTYQDIARFF